MKPAAWALAALLLLGSGLFSCGKTDPGAKNDGGMTMGQGGSGGGGGRGGTAGAPDGGATSPCLDSPGDLPRPPNGRLPCELIPPGLAL